MGSLTDALPRALSASSLLSTVHTGTSIVGLLILVYIWQRSINYLKRRYLPPGPPGWPVIGNLLDLRGKLPHRVLMQLSKKYGPVMYLKLGYSGTLVVDSPAMLDEILKNQDEIFAARPPNLMSEIFFYNHQDVATASPGPLWRSLRRLYSTKLFTSQQLALFQDVRMKAFLDIIERMLSEGTEGKLVNLSRLTKVATFNNITRVLFSKSYYGHKTRSTDSHGRQKEFQELMQEWNIASGKFEVSDHIPWLRILDIGGLKKDFWNLRREFDDFISLVLEERRHKDMRDVTAPKDTMDGLLHFQETNKIKYSDDLIKANLSTLLLGGTDSSGGQMTWMLAELLRNPEVKQKVMEELDNVVGRERLVEEADLKRLPYLQAVLRESMRLHPSSPLLFPHYNTETTTVAGYKVPRNTRVLFNVYSICRNPEVWENPSKFDPTRFVDNLVDLRGSDSRIMPFSAGRRGCPGANLALILVPLGVAQILHTCDVSLPEGMKPEDMNMDEDFGITMFKAEPLMVRVSPRLPHHVYAAAGMSL